MDSDSSIAKEFQIRVKATLDYEADQNALYTSLKKYQKDHDLAALVNSMKELLASPDRVTLFDAIRPFVSVNQQVEYNNLSPYLSSKKARLVYLTRRGTEPLGFKFRGGLEHGIGLYISEVTQGSQADLKGLMPGDEIIQVNGFNVSQVTHSEALGAMKLKKMLTLKVIGTGLVPIKEYKEDLVTWQFVKSPSKDRPIPQDMNGQKWNIVAKERTVFGMLAEGQRLGCGISSGHSSRPGIFIHKVTPHTMAEQLGFQVGDQIISVNDASFLDISHADALVALKSSRHLKIILKSWEEDTTDTAPPPPRAAETEEVIYASVTRRSKRENKNQETSTKPDVKEMAPQGEAVVEVHASQGGGVEVKPKTEDQPSWWASDPYTQFTSMQINNRELKKLEIVKDGPLEMYLEGGLDSPLGGKVVVADLNNGGAAKRNGIGKGDQIMMLEGQKLIDVTLEEAQKAFKTHMQGELDGSGIIRLIVAVAPPKNYEDEVTFF